VTEYQQGDALIVRLELTLEVCDDTGEVLTAWDGFFIENHGHAPKVEHQIAELASGDLGMMYVHVELAPELRRRVQERATAI
jgi:hypothetical protein